MIFMKEKKVWVKPFRFSLEVIQNYNYQLQLKVVEILQAW